MGPVRMLERGLSIVPLAGGKRPAVRWKDYQQRRPSWRDVKTWPACAEHAIITGAISGLVVIDCDTLEDGIWCFRHLSPTPCVVRSPRGIHLYYRHPGYTVRNAVSVCGALVDGRLATGLAMTEPEARWDVRGDGGYVVAPGDRYRWLCGSLDAIGDRLPVFRREWRPERPAPKAPPAPIEYPRQSMVDRAAQYVDRCDPAISGQGGDRQTWKVTLAIVQGFGLRGLIARQMLERYSQRCEPPWSAEALTHKLARAEQAELQGERGYLANRDRQERV